MYQKIKAKFKANPTIFYACSIVASWAGVGSLMNFRTLAINNGAAAAIIWAVFNSLACIFFGLFAEYIPTVRRIMQSKVMFYFIGFLTVFQTWTQMSGIYEIFGDTPIGTTGGTLIVYGTCLVFLFMLLKEGMIRNVLSDGFSWVVVYGLLAVVVIAALVYTHGAFVNIDPGLTAAGIQTGLYKGFLLLPGPFTYPYYYSLFSYNDKNEDGTQHGNMKKSFVLAGVMFGVYMVLAALLTWVNFSPLLNTLKAILITIIALSSLSTYLYSEYLVFGENIGFLIDVLTVTSWQLVVRPDGTIIDGFHRWTVSGREPLLSLLGGKVPVVVVDHHGDESADVYGTITHNRARGTHLLEPMKAIVKKLIDEGKTVEEIGKQLGMKPEEIFRLSGFTKDEFLNMMTKGHDTYSKAQVIRSV